MTNKTTALLKDAILEAAERVGKAGRPNQGDPLGRHYLAFASYA